MIIVIIQLVVLVLVDKLATSSNLGNIYPILVLLIIGFALGDIAFLNMTNYKKAGK